MAAGALAPGREPAPRIACYPRRTAAAAAAVPGHRKGFWAGTVSAAGSVNAGLASRRRRALPAHCVCAYKAADCFSGDWVTLDDRPAAGGSGCCWCKARWQLWHGLMYGCRHEGCRTPCMVSACHMQSVVAGVFNATMLAGGGTANKRAHAPGMGTGQRQSPTTSTLLCPTQHLCKYGKCSAVQCRAWPED